MLFQGLKAANLRRTISKTAICLFVMPLISSSLASADILFPNGTNIFISQKNADLPANDLLYTPPGGQQVNIDPHQAILLKRPQNGAKGIDLSLLEPMACNPVKEVCAYVGVDTKADHQLDDAIPAQPGDILQFQAQLSYLPTFFAANVSGNGQNYRMILGTTLHTFLLRKEMLRRLGYKVPPIKWMSQVRVRFSDPLTRHNIVKNAIDQASDGIASRWCIASQAVVNEEAALAPGSTAPPCTVAPAGTTFPDDLEVILQDVALMNPTDPYYDLAIAPSIDPTKNGVLVDDEARTLRSLVIPYGLLDIPESANQVPWAMATVQNQNINFPVPDTGLFNCTLDDALWMVRKVLKFTRQDFSDMVSAAYFPKPVGDLIVEKLIARRDSLAITFNIPANNMVFNQNITEGADLVGGRLITPFYPGYASRWVWTDPASPLDHLSYYFYSILESNALEGIATYINSVLPQQSTAMVIANNQKNLAAKAQQAYMATGQKQVIHFKTWTAPTIAPGIDVSRDIIAGPYMGLNNLLQLSDTFGAHVNAGIYLGADGLSKSEALTGGINGGISYIYTHIKPITDLNLGIKEPLKTLYIPNIIKETQNVFSSAAAAQGGVPVDLGKEQAAVTTAMNNLTSYLGLQESLIITQTINAGATLTPGVILGANPLTAIVISATINPAYVTLTRTHFYRSTATQIQIFKDNGEFDDFTLSADVKFGVTPGFPIFDALVSKMSGAGKTKVYTVNIDPNLTDNPQFFQAANAVSEAMRTGSTALLDALQGPVEIDTKFDDVYSTKRLLFWVERKLRTEGNITISNPVTYTDADGKPAVRVDKDNFLLMSTGRQTGVNYQLPFIDAVNYLFQRLTNSNQFTISSPTGDNPGSSFLGSSQTRVVQFQSRVNGPISDPYINIAYRWEGWQKSVTDVMTLVNTQINAKYGYTVFPPNILHDTNILQLYDIGMSLQVYKNGIAQVYNMANEAQFITDHCRTSPSGCDHLKNFDRYFKALHLPAKIIDQAASEMNMLSELEQGLNFHDFVTTVGFNNLFLSGAVQGFRSGSEIISNPINANTYGAADQNNPDGVVTSAENIIGVQDGEMFAQWMRTVL
jgi:hypothetical protein